MSDQNTVRILARQLINGLEHKGAIQYTMKNRDTLTNNLCKYLSTSFATEEQIKEQALSILDQGREQLIEQGLTEEQFYETTRKNLVGQYNGEKLASLYLKNSIRDIAGKLPEFLLSDELVDEVFSSDEELLEISLDVLKKFDPANMV